MNLRIDITKENFKANKIKQNTSNDLVIELFNDGAKYNVTGKTIALHCVNSAGNVLIQGDNITINENILTVKLMKDMTAIAGRMFLQVDISSGDWVTASFKIPFIVDARVNKMGVVVPSLVVDVMTSLSQKITEALGVKKDTEDLIKNGGALAKGLFFSKSGWRVNINDFPRLAGETEDAPRFQRAIDFLQRLNTATDYRFNKGGMLEVPAGDYYFSSSVYLIKSKDTANTIPFPIYIKGEVNAFEGHLGLGVSFYVNTNNPVFMINIKADNTPGFTTNGYGHFTMENINFVVKDADKSTANKATAIRLHMTRLILKNITCQSMYSLIAQAQYLNGVQTYSDFWILENIRFRNLRGVGISCWYCDNLTVKVLFCEYSERASKVLDITNSQGFDINGFCCAMNERFDDGTVIADSAMIYVTSSIGTIGNIYIENVKQFGSAIALVSSNVVLNSYSERFEGNTGIVMWGSKLKINGSSFKAKRNDGYFDIQAKGDTNNKNSIIISNTDFYDMSRPGGVVALSKRDVIASFPNNHIDLYSDDIKNVRVKAFRIDIPADGTNPARTEYKVKCVDYYNTKDLDIGYTIDNNGLVINSSSIFRFKKVRGFTPITSLASQALRLSYKITEMVDGVGGYYKISAFRETDGLPIGDWKQENTGIEKSYIDFIIHFE